MNDRVHNLVAVGRVSVANDGEDLQQLQITEKAYGKGFADRILDKVPRLTEFGFTSLPPIGSEAVMLRRNGDRGLSMVISTSHRPSRPKGLQPGDTALYDVRGAFVKLTDDGLLIDCAGLPARITNATTVTIEASDKIHLEAPTVEIQGNATISGTLVVDGAIASKAEVTARQDGVAANLGQLRDAYVGHHHGGVDTGSGVSGLSDHLV
jgi:phage baseplate assembly protein V